MEILELSGRAVSEPKMFGSAAYQECCAICGTLARARLQIPCDLAICGHGVVTVFSAARGGIKIGIGRDQSHEGWDGARTSPKKILCGAGVALANGAKLIWARSRRRLGTRARQS